MLFETLNRIINIVAQELFSLLLSFVQLNSIFQSKIQIGPSTVVIWIFLYHFFCKLQLSLMNFPKICQPNSVAPGVIILLIFLNKDSLSFDQLFSKVISELC